MSEGPGKFEAARPALGCIAFTALFLLCLGILAILERAGAPRWLASFALGGIAVALAPVAGIAGRTLRLADFFHAGRRLPSVWNGAAMAVSLVGGVWFLGLSGPALALGRDGLVFLLAPLAGLFAFGVLIAPAIRASGAATLPDYLGLRFDDLAIRLAAAFATLICAGALIVAELSAAGRLAELFLGLGHAPVVLVCGAAMLVATIFGGLRGLTAAQVATLVFVVAAVLLPLILLFTPANGLAAPPPGYARALAAIAAADAARGSAVGFLAPFGHAGFDRWNFFALLIGLAAGIAALPQLSARATAAESVGGARRSAAVALFYAALAAAILPLHAVFAEWTAASAPLSFIVRQPGVVGALFAAAGIAAAVAAAASLLHGLAMSIAQDSYAGYADPGASPGRRLVAARLALFACGLVFGLAALRVGDPFAAAALGLSVAAAGLFPIAVLACWPGVGRHAALAAVTAGLAFTLIPNFVAAAAPRFAISILGMAPVAGSAGLTWLGLRPAAFGFIGLVAAFLAAAGATAYPGVHAKLAGLRRAPPVPSGPPPVEPEPSSANPPPPPG